MSRAWRQGSCPSSERDYLRLSWSSRRWICRGRSLLRLLSIFESKWTPMFPMSGVIATDSSRCSRTSLATRSNSRRPAVVSRRARHREMTKSCSGWRTPAAASRPRTCPMSSTDSGKQPRRGVRALGSGSPSPRASSKLTAGASGSRAQRGAGVLSSSRFPRPLQRRIDFPIAVDLIVQPNQAHASNVRKAVTSYASGWAKALMTHYISAGSATPADVQACFRPSEKLISAKFRCPAGINPDFSPSFISPRISQTDLKEKSGRPATKCH